MSIKKAVVTFDEEHFIVYGEDKLLISAPSAVVRKKSAAPVAVAFGKDALLMRGDLPEGTMFCRPFRGNTVADMPGAKLTIRNYFKKLFGFNYSVEIYILISTGISEVGRSKIEQAFITCGYKNIYIVERPYLLARIAEKKGFDLVVDMEQRTVEAALCEKGKVIEAHAIDVGTKHVEEELTASICAEHELSPCIKPAEKSGERSFILTTYAEVPVLTCCSLSRYSYIPVTAIGQDVISGENKAVTVPAKELLPIVVTPYEKAVELITAIMLGHDDKVESVIKKGILYLGKPTEINYFCEFMHDKTNLPVFTVADPFLQVKTLYDLLGDADFLHYSLGFHA